MVAGLIALFPRMQQLGVLAAVLDPDRAEEGEKGLYLGADRISGVRPGALQRVYGAEGDAERRPCPF